MWGKTTANEPWLQVFPKPAWRPRIHVVEASSRQTREVRKGKRDIFLGQAEPPFLGELKSVFPIPWRASRTLRESILVEPT